MRIRSAETTSGFRSSNAASSLNISIQTTRALLQKGPKPSNRNVPPYIQPSLSQDPPFCCNYHCSSTSNANLGRSQRCVSPQLPSPWLSRPSHLQQASTPSLPHGTDNATTPKPTSDSNSSRTSENGSKSQALWRLSLPAASVSRRSMRSM